MDGGAPFCVAPMTWQDGLSRYPPSESQRWNTIPLRTGDYDEEFYSMIRDLERRHQKNEFSDADFHRLELTFSLLTAENGQYNLIPNGSEIRVTKSNAYEYFQRVHRAYESLQQVRAVNIPAVPQQQQQQPRNRATATGLRLTAQDLPSIEGICWCAQHDPEQLIFLPGEKLRWAVVPRNSDFMIRLQPDGEQIPVEPDDLPLFLNVVLTTMSEVHRAIETFGYYPPNNVCAAPPERLENAFIRPNAPPAPVMVATPTAPPRRVNSDGRTALYASARAAAAAAAAASMQDRRFAPSASPMELEKQRALFSPTHETAGILSPFQELNL